MNKSEDLNFVSILQSEDDLGAVIRSHIHIEQIINQIVELLTPNPDELKHLQLDYAGKIHLICAMGIETDLKKGLLAIGNLRNNFSHRLDFSLDKSVVNNLYSSLSSYDKNVLHNTYKNSRKRDESLTPYNELNPRNKFILIAIVIRNLALQILKETKAKTV